MIYINKKSRLWIESKLINGLLIMRQMLSTNVFNSTTCKSTSTSVGQILQFDAVQGT